MTKRFAAVLLLCAAGGLVGCSGKAAVRDVEAPADAQIVEIRSDNMAYSTNSIEVEKGRPVKLVFINADSSLHDLSVDKISLIDKKEAAGHDHGAVSLAPQADLHVGAKRGEQAAVLFTPTEAGEYTFYCTVPGHKAAGMIGKLIVKG